MLSLRLAIVVSLSAVALWGLFALLDNLREPELLRSPKAIVVKGCDPIESDDARVLCPQLFCQKALLDAKAAHLKSTFEVTVNQSADDVQLIGGVARTSGAPSHEFACVLESGKVVEARLTIDGELEELVRQPDGWSLEEAEE